MPRLSDRARRRVIARQLESNRRLEARYERALSGVMRSLHADMMSALEPKLPLFARADASHSPFTGVIDVVLMRHVQRVPQTVGPMFDAHAKSVAAENAKSMRLIGVRPSALGLGTVLTTKRNENLAYIEKAQRAYAQDVREIFEKPETFGLRVEEIKKQLQERGNVSESRAELIARDQTLKLNGAITKTRQENAGIGSYTWSTSLDERVRPEHAALEGKVFAWTAPPRPGHPGEDFQCRCVAIPVIPEIENAAPPVVAPAPPPPPPPPVAPVPASPPPLELAMGQHAQNIETDLSPAETDKFLKSVADQPTLEFLEKNPLNNLAFKTQTFIGTTPVNGSYNPASRELQVRIARDPSTYGRSFVPGASWSISSTTKTEEEAAQATLRHELGHHVHMLDGYGSNADQIVQAAYVRAQQSNVFVTNYAASMAEEYFAESYAAYFLRRGALQAHDPNGFTMVEDVLRVRGMLP